MVQSLFGFFRYVALEFGTLILFWVVLYTAGIKPAIAAIVVYILLDSAYRWWRKIPVTRIYVLTSALAVVFGCVDLLAANPFMIKYEAVITNVATGIFFVVGARGEKSLIQEVAEKRDSFPDRADIRQFFRLFTLFWAAYFFRQSRGLFVARHDLAAGTCAGAAHGAWRGQPRLHVRDQLLAWPAAVLLVPAPRTPASGRNRPASARIHLIVRAAASRAAV